jgi:hypothetical protein
LCGGVAGGESCHVAQLMSRLDCVVVLLVVMVVLLVVMLL